MTLESLGTAASLRITIAASSPGMIVPASSRGTITPASLPGITPPSRGFGVTVPVSLAASIVALDRIVGHRDGETAAGEHAEEMNETTTATRSERRMAEHGTRIERAARYPATFRAG